jgi:glycosyltransferase involved in cell wall biosynthesis
MISIITPVYNGDRFIEACLNVVINQHCPDVEHLIIDGGSTDHTVAILQKYAAQYPHIRWISEPDRGQSDAMNKGIALAKGEILGILNVDDYYEPNVLNRILTCFQTLPEPGLLVGNCRTIDSQGRSLHVNRPQKLHITDLLLGTSIHPHPVNPSAYFYHTSLHQRMGLYKVEEHFAMDLDFLLRAVQVAHVHYVDEIWGNYRYIEGTKTFEDQAQGTSDDRAQQLFQTYKQALPLSQRWQLRGKYALYQQRRTLRSLGYFAQHPQHLLPNLKTKILKALS